MRRLGFVYPYADQLEMHTKLSVSELKEAGKAEHMDPSAAYLYRLSGEGSDGAEELSKDISGQSKEQTVPETEHEDATTESMKQVDRIRGARRGTFLHRIMEKIDFTHAESSDAVERQIGELCDKGLLEREEAEAVSHRPIHWFFGGKLAKRMTKAAERGKLYRENRFVMGVPASDIGGLYQGDEMILVQGMIDAWFEEDDGLVIVDYKSDRVDKETGEDVLRERYAVQLKYYRKALEQSTGKPVKECRIYSFSLGRDILVED